jgi:predicted RNA-binding Zn ribbon-like protein
MKPGVPPSPSRYREEMVLRGMMTRPSGSHRDHVVEASIELANFLAPGYSGGYQYAPPTDFAERAKRGSDAFADVNGRWPPFEASEAVELTELAIALHQIFLNLAAQEVGSAVPLINELLRAYPAAPHVSTSPPWSLHYHDHSLPPVAAWQVGCAAALGSFVSSGAWQYIGRCEAERCDRVFIDDTKNRSRRFCTKRCQNRDKVRAFRLRATL